MATVTEPLAPIDEVCELHNGDRMTQKEFHRIYEKTPANVKAELIGGIVYMASPLGRKHGVSHPELSFVFVSYKGRTPGVEVGDNCTVILNDDSEPQPDLFLRLLPEFGGQTSDRDDYIVGAPELVAEIAHSSEAIDLHRKRDDYTNYGVVEYIVVCLRERQIRWFDLKAGQEIPAGPDSVFRSPLFPGLWVHGPALLARNTAQLVTTLEQGLATPEHDAFVSKLASQRR